MATTANDQAFWNEFMRRPEAKAAYQAEKKLQVKKQAWLEAKREIDEQAVHRQMVADALEDCPADIKKLIAPMFHIRVVERFLWMIYEDWQKNRNELIGGSFADKLKEERNMTHLTKLREQFHEGGEDRMEDIEKNWYSICNDIVAEEEKKKEEKPAPIDIHTLKHVLEFGQECKREGNNKFKEGLYEEALHIYSQGDEVMRKWKVDKHLKNEHKWLQDYHIACLKNKAQAALKLDLFQTALEAADAALRIDAEDHKAWYRKVQAEKGLGHFDDAEASLARLEDVAQWCPDKRQILQDCEAERKRLQLARMKHKQGTKEMLGKAFEAGVFSTDREKAELEEVERHQKEQEAREKEQAEEKAKRPIAPPKPLVREITLTAALAGDLLDDLAESYEQRWFQERVRKCARDSNFDRMLFLRRLKDIGFEVQKPILEKWGFPADDHGVREMTASIRDHAGKDGKSMPSWLKDKQDRCLELLYGGTEDGGMAAILKA